MLGRVHADHRGVSFLRSNAGDADYLLIEHAVAAMRARRRKQGGVLRDRYNVFIFCNAPETAAIRLGVPVNWIFMAQLSEDFVRYPGNVEVGILEVNLVEIHLILFNVL